MVSITNINQPSFQLPQLLEGETAALFVDDASVPAVYDPLVGTLTPLGMIPDGEHRISFALLDRAGAETVRSPELVVRIKATLPATPIMPPVMRDALTVPDESQVTLEARPDFLIEMPADGETPRLYANGRPLAVSWSPSDRLLVPLAALDDGAYVFRYTLLDVAGNESAASPELNLRIMAGQIGAPERAPRLVVQDSAAAISNDASSGIVFCGEAPSFTIDVPPDGQTPSLIVDGVRVLASWYPATATLTPLVPLENGVRQIGYTLKNVVGRVSGISPALQVRISPEPVPAAKALVQGISGLAAVDVLVRGADGLVEAAGVSVDPAAGSSVDHVAAELPGLSGTLDVPLAAGESLFVIVGGTWTKARVSGLGWSITLPDSERGNTQVSLIRQSAAGNLGEVQVLPERAIRTMGKHDESQSLTPGNDDSPGVGEEGPAADESARGGTPSPRSARSGSAARARRIPGIGVDAATVASPEVISSVGLSSIGASVAGNIGAHVKDADQIYLVSRGQWIAASRSGSVWTAFDPGSRAGDWSSQLVCVSASGQLDTLPGVAELGADAAWVTTRPAPADGHGVLGFLVEASSATNAGRPLCLQLEPFETVSTVGALQIVIDGGWVGWHAGMRISLPPGKASMFVALRTNGVDEPRLAHDLRLIAVPAGSGATDPGCDTGNFQPCSEGGLDHDKLEHTLARI